MQVFASPFCVSQRVAVGDVNDGMIIEPAERTARSVGPPPVGAKLERPPLAPVAEIDCVFWRIENERPGLEHVRQSARIVLRIWRDLGEGDMTGRPDKLAKPVICHRRAINPEAVDRYPMQWRFFRIILVRPHAKSTAGYPDHIAAVRALRCRVLRPNQRENVDIRHCPALPP